MTTETDLLRAVLARPLDDTPRLVTADWYDDNEQPDRAEFIRLQCEIARLLAIGAHEGESCNTTGTCAECVREVDVFRLREREKELFERYAVVWFDTPRLDSIRLSVPHRSYTGSYGVVERGFVSTIGVPTLATLFGGPCGRCCGHGHTNRGDDDFDLCHVCSGTGTTPGIAAEVFGRQPVTRVVVGDREPDGIGDRFCWVRDRSGLDPEWGGATVPDAVFVALVGGEKESAGRDWLQRFGVEDEWVIYPTRDAALTALSDALVNVCRRRAGLEPIS